MAKCLLVCQGGRTPAVSVLVAGSASELATLRARKLAGGQWRECTRREWDAYVTAHGNPDPDPAHNPEPSPDAPAPPAKPAAASKVTAPK